VYPSSLLATIEMALARYAEQHELRERAAQLEQDLEEAKLVDRAKGLLMVHHRLTDAGAAQWLQQTADGHGKPIRRIALDVIADLTGGRIAPPVTVARAASGRRHGQALQPLTDMGVTP
jgi:AmiR/NasT family two-component response regulator